MIRRAARIIAAVDPQGPLRIRGRSPARACVFVFLLAFGVRWALLASPMVPLGYVMPETRSELGRVARTLALEGRYADPYLVPTGPTAHPVPLATGLLALIYRLFGLTLTAGFVRCFLCIAAYSAMYAMLPWVADRCGLGGTAGLLGGAAGALYPLRSSGEALGWSVAEPCAAILLGLTMGALARRWSDPRPQLRAAFAVGVGFGVAFHFAPALLLVLLGYLGFELVWRRVGAAWRAVGVTVLGAALACAPWAWRNWSAFGETFFIRSNFGLELRLANHGGADADIEVLDAREGDAMRHPGCNREEAEKVREWGEMEYMRRARGEAFAWIGAHPGEFARLTAARFVHYWLGPVRRPLAAVPFSLVTVLALLGLRRAWRTLTVAQRALLLVPLATFPLVYYTVVYMANYPVPVAWILLILGGAEVRGWFARQE